MQDSGRAAQGNPSVRGSESRLGMSLEYSVPRRVLGQLCESYVGPLRRGFSPVHREMLDDARFLGKVVAAPGERARGARHVANHERASGRKRPPSRRDDRDERRESHSITSRIG